MPLCLWHNVRCRSRPAGNEQMSTGHLHFMVRILLFQRNKAVRPNGQTALFGGPEEIRTPDPYNANVMRSQLRYRPMGMEQL